MRYSRYIIIAGFLFLAPSAYGATNAIQVASSSNQYGEILNWAALDGLNDYTIEGWVNNTSTSPAYSTAFSIATTSISFGRVTTENGVGNQGFNFSTSYTGANDADGFEDSTKLTLNTWVHVAVTHNSTTKKTSVLFNGIDNPGYNLQQVGAGSIATTTDSGVYLGRDAVASGNPSWTGLLGGTLRVWNYNRNAAQIRDNYLKTLTCASEPGLVVNINFTEGSGTTLANECDGSHNMTLYGTPSWVTGPTTTAKTYATTTVNVQVFASGDDGEQNTAGTTNVINSGDLEVTYDGLSPGFVGVRFQGVAIPNAQTISKAELWWVGDEAQSTGVVTSTIWGNAVDDAAVFSTTAGDISGRATTTASSAWTVLATSIGAFATSSDVTSIVQEIVNRAGWTSGNDMAFILYGVATNRRTFVAWDTAGGLGGPMLHVEYAAPAAPAAASSRRKYYSPGIIQ